MCHVHPNHIVPSVARSHTTWGDVVRLCMMRMGVVRRSIPDHRASRTQMACEGPSLCEGVCEFHCESVGVARWACEGLSDESATSLRVRYCMLTVGVEDAGRSHRT